MKTIELTLRVQVPLDEKTQNITGELNSIKIEMTSDGALVGGVGFEVENGTFDDDGWWVQLEGTEDYETINGDIEEVYLECK